MDDTDYAFGRSRAEYDRLIEQGELFRPLTERMLVAAGITRGMQVLDVGCGVGDVSFLVAKLVGAEGSVLGVDLDPEALKLAEQRRAAQRISNVEFRQSDARSVDPARLFDAAVGRFILHFMKDPTEAIRQVAERVRFGGIVAFHELDSRLTIAPAMNLPVLARLQDLLVRTFECTGARDVGPEQPRAAGGMSSPYVEGFYEADKLRGSSDENRSTSGAPHLPFERKLISISVPVRCCCPHASASSDKRRRGHRLCAPGVMP
jgi:2-polyprenyl-3-methyl-5-hydroxy-6-metoxy-1,4-benzoquinol methylase